MKVAFLALCALVSMNLFASEPISLKSGQVVAQDVLGLWPVTVQVSAPADQDVSFDVVDEFAGFECRVTAIVGLGEQEDGQGLWLAQVEWTAGADVSGCTVEVKHPAWEKPAALNLYMNY